MSQATSGSVAAPKRPRSPSTDSATRALTVTALKAIVATLPRDEMSESEGAAVVDAYRKAASYNSDAVISQRKEVESYAIRVQDESIPLHTACRLLKFTVMELVTAMNDAGATVTFDDVWNAATDVFDPRHNACMRFVHCVDFTASERTKPYEDGTIVPIPLEVSLDNRCTKIHIFLGEGGIGKTVRLMMGAYCRWSRTYNRTLGMYFSGSSFDGRVDEETLAKAERNIRLLPTTRRGNERNMRTSRCNATLKRCGAHRRMR